MQEELHGSGNLLEKLREMEKTEQKVSTNLCVYYGSAFKISMSVYVSDIIVPLTCISTYLNNFLC